MRKKYLSALLFGALLFASAGTFTSCKDYDDDINNLQEQIDKVAADLESLKATVDQLGGVQDVKVEGGKLLVTAGGETISYDLPTGEGSDVDKTVVELDGQDLKVDGQVIGQVGDKVTVNADGYLCVNGEPTEIKAGKYAIIDNESENSVTITLPDANGELKTIELAKYSAADEITSLKFEDDKTYFHNVAYATVDKGISWNLAATDVDWKGKKGPVERNQLLVGQISTVTVQVTPAKFDMSVPGRLSLKDSKGNEAPVKVSAVENNRLMTFSSRAGGNTGSWIVSIEMGDDINETNIEKEFVVKNNELKAYALCVDGEPVSNYDITIKTREKVDGTYGLTYKVGDLTYIDKDGLEANVTKDKMPIGTTALNLILEDQGSTTGLEILDHVYDSYITFEGSNQSLAKSKGIVADGMTITAPESAAGTTITATIYVLDVSGKEFKSTLEFTVASNTASSVEADDVKHVVMPAKVNNGNAEAIEPIAIVNLEKVFEQISPATLQKVKDWSQLTIVEEKDQAGFLVASTNENVHGEAIIFDGTNKDYVSSYNNKTNVQFLKKDGKAWLVTEDEDDLCDLATIKIPFEKLEAKIGDTSNKVTNVANLIAKDAKPGKYTLYLVATADKDSDTAGQEIFRVKMDVEIALPSFDQLFSKQSELWNEAGKYVATVTPTDLKVASESTTWGTENAAITLSTAFKAVDNTNAMVDQLGFAFQKVGDEYPIANLDVAYNGNNLNAISGKDGAAILDKNVVFNEKKNAIALSEISNIVAYTSVLPGLQEDQVAGLTGTTDQKDDQIKALQERFTVPSTAFTAELKAMLDDITYAYYENGATVSTPVQLDKDGYINQYALNKDNKAIESGFGFEWNKKLTAAGTELDKNNNKLWDIVGSNGTAFGKFKMYVTESNANDLTDIAVEAPSTSAGNIAWNASKKLYQVTGLEDAQTATVTFTVKDACGIEYPIKVVVRK